MIGTPDFGCSKALGVSSNRRSSPHLVVRKERSHDVYKLHAQLVSRVQRQEAGADEELHVFIVSRVRYGFRRKFGRLALDEDRTHDVYVMVLDAIRNGQLRDPERLVGFVAVIAQRVTIAGIRTVMNARNNIDSDYCGELTAPDSPFVERLRNEQVAVLGNALTRLPPVQHEILMRFYVKEQDRETICREMRLTATQFRLAKSRGKKRLAAIGKKLLHPRISLALA